MKNEWKEGRNEKMRIKWSKSTDKKNEKWMKRRKEWKNENKMK